MASRANKTTFAKLDRERRLREKRAAKKERRLARQQGTADGTRTDESAAASDVVWPADAPTTDD